MRKRFDFARHTFRITKSFSYNMAYEAFCKGYVNPKELMGKEVLIPNEYDYEEEYTIVEVANKQMGLDFFGKHVTRTYITAIDSGKVDSYITIGKEIGEDLTVLKCGH